jgi:hypothetical protein
MPGRVRGHQLRGPEPQRQRRARLVHHRPRPDRGLPPAALALPQAAALLDTDPAATATPATKPIRPTRGKQIGTAGRLVGEPSLEPHDRRPEVGPRHRATVDPTPDEADRIVTSGGYECDAADAAEDPEGPDEDVVVELFDQRGRRRLVAPRAPGLSASSGAAVIRAAAQRPASSELATGSLRPCGAL